jgi:hypothetical protein
MIEEGLTRFLQPTAAGVYCSRQLGRFATHGPSSEFGSQRHGLREIVRLMALTIYEVVAGGDEEDWSVLVAAHSPTEARDMLATTNHG